MIRFNGGRLSPIFLTIMTTMTSVISMAVAQADTDPIAWVHQDKIRLGWTPDRYSQYQVMKDAGMNAVMPRWELDVTVSYDPEKAAQPLSERDAAILSDLLKGSELAKDVGLRYFHCLGLACEQQTYVEGFRDNPARFNDGNLPSPIDPVYFKRVVLDRTDRVLRLLSDRDKYALDGIIVDPEMYALNDSLPGEADYGTFAFNTYLKETSQAAPANVKDVQTRQAWLVAQQQDQKYVRWQFERVRDFGRQMRELVDSYRSDIIIGYIIYEDRMWFNAMAEGMTTKEIPVFIGPETTYSGVMDASMVAYFDQMRKSIGVPCLLVPGVAMGLVNGEPPVERLKVLEGNIYQRSQHVPGYWIWAVYNFGTDEQQTAFFDSLKVVNDALDEQARSGKVSAELKARPLPVPVPPGFEELLSSGAAMKPLAADVARASLPFEEAKLRGSYALLLWPRARERQAVTIRAIQLGKYLDRCEVKLFSQSGGLLWDEPVAMNESRAHWLPDAAGPFSVQLIGAGQNAFAIESVDCPAMIYTGNLLELNSQQGSAGRYYFYVPPGRNEFKMNVLGHGGETADYTLFDPSNKPVRVWKTHKSNTTETIPVTQPGVWCMQVDFLIDDGGFGLVDLPNLFALRPEDVMVSPD